jgi:putative ABC transport system substrate-binding protein
MPLIALAVALTLLAAACSSATPAASVASGRATKVKIGIFLMESQSLLTQIAGGFESEFLARTHLRRSQVEFDVKNAQGQETLIETIAQQYAQGGDAMVAVIGTPAVIALAKLTHTKPLIAVAMGDPVGAGVARSLDRPGTNVSGSIDYIDPAKLLPQLLRVRPRFSSLGTIYNPANENSQVWVKALRAAAGKDHIRLNEATITSSGQDAAAAQSLQGRAAAILIGPDADTLAGLPAIAQSAASAHQALYLVGGDTATPGVLASLGPDYPALGRQAGAVAAEVENGRAIGSIPFSRPQSIQWSVNPRTQAALKVTLPAPAGS